MSFNGALYNNSLYVAALYFDALDAAAIQAAADEEKKIFNAARMRRQRLRMIKTVPNTKIEQPPLGPQAPMVVPNPEMVARIAAQLRNVRGRGPRGGGFGGGTTL